jgi:hypothetical protein
MDRCANLDAMSSELPELRASHDDRDRVVETLRVAGGDGRLTAEELDARVESALTARTLGELAVLTADLPVAASEASLPKDVLVVQQTGSRYQRSGRWVVPKRIEVRTKLCRVVLDFTDAVMTTEALLIDAHIELNKLILVTTPDIVVDGGGLALTFSKVKLAPDAGKTGGVPRLRIEVVGSLKHAKLIEQQKPSRRST